MSTRFFYIYPQNYHVLLFLRTFADFAIFEKHWLETYCFPPLYCEGTDINKRDGVNMQDLYEFTIDRLNSN